MRHLMFCFAVGFAIVGGLMLYACLSKFVSMVSSGYNTFDVIVLAGAMGLPFVISTLSWRDWKMVQAKKDAGQQDLNTQKSSGGQRSVLWTGKPWIVPSAVGRSILIVAAAVIIFWLEFSFGIADKTILNIQAILWTGLALTFCWLLALVHLLELRASNTYILRDDGLEIREGIWASRSFVVTPSGFSDLEVVRSVSGRILNSGDIMIRTQGDRDVTMVKIRNPLGVADHIREVVSRPIVRIMEPETRVEAK